MPRSNTRGSGPGEGGAERLPGDAGVVRVHFTAEDMARTRFCSGPAPLVEAALLLGEFGRRPAQNGNPRWLRQARLAFPVTARPLLDLIPRAGRWPDFLTPEVTDLDEALETVRATPRWVLRKELAWLWTGAARPPLWMRSLADGKPEVLEMLACGLLDFYAACVAPHWTAIVASFRRGVAEQVSVLAAGGLAEMFSTLHAVLAWEDGSLVKTRASRAGELWLDGRGVQLAPSASWSGPPLFSLNPWHQGCSTVIYSASSTGAVIGAQKADGLAGLLGDTRAAVLRSLRDPCGTADLAARLGISAASASEHSAALRRADLVQTVRRGRGVCHSLAPLGRSLLNGVELAAVIPSGRVTGSAPGSRN